MTEQWNHLMPFDGRASVTIREIQDQRAKGWTDFHPEDFCHRCGGRNLSWWIDNDAWNAVMRPEGPDSPWQWNEIICPACFADVFEAKFGLTSFSLQVDAATIGGRAFTSLPNDRKGER